MIQFHSNRVGYYLNQKVSIIKIITYTILIRVGSELRLTQIPRSHLLSPCGSRHLRIAHSPEAHGFMLDAWSFDRDLGNTRKGNWLPDGN